MLGILLAATVAAAPPPAAHPIPCPNVHKQKTAVDRGRIGPKTLAELPDGELYHAVWKEAGGCPIDEVFQKGRWVDRWAGAGPPQPRQAGGEGR